MPPKTSTYEMYMAWQAEQYMSKYRWLSGKESAHQCRRHSPWVRKIPGEGNGNPLQYSCLENPMDGGAWWATVHGSQRVGHD